MDQSKWLDPGQDRTDAKSIGQRAWVLQNQIWGFTSNVLESFWDPPINF